uniref:Uncharacterized protein n=1 Tax=Anguilla anguilla TaxID=7936 RepID=A0A0E9RW54_ANGAN
MQNNYLMFSNGSCRPLWHHGSISFPITYSSLTKKKCDFPGN